MCRPIIAACCDQERGGFHRGVHPKSDIRCGMARAFCTRSLSFGAAEDMCSVSRGVTCARCLWGKQHEQDVQELYSYLHAEQTHIRIRPVREVFITDADRTATCMQNKCTSTSNLFVRSSLPTQLYTPSVDSYGDFFYVFFSITFCRCYATSSM